MTAYVITNARVLDGTGREPFAGEVAVDGNRIVAVTSGGHGPRPDGTRVIDGAGGTLMPGLIEAHAHLSFPDLFSHDITRLPVEEHMLITVRNARTMLGAGYTSAFSAASAKPRLDVVLRREIEAGRVPGPRLLANGPEITVTGGLGDTNLLHLPYDEAPTFCWVANGPDEVRRVARTATTAFRRARTAPTRGTSRCSSTSSGSRRWRPWWRRRSTGARSWAHGSPRGTDTLQSLDHPSATDQPPRCVNVPGCKRTATESRARGAARGLLAWCLP